MKQVIREFFRRGLVACGFGPLILAAVYVILQQAGLQTLTVREVCIGIISLWLLAFLAGGMNVVYQIERLPLMGAILIHGMALYLGYLVTYLVNDWLAWGITPFLVFTAIFVLSYLAVWAVIYTVTKQNTDKVNAMLKDIQQIE
jgi:hypothetical protein